MKSQARVVHKRTLISFPFSVPLLSSLQSHLFLRISSTTSISRMATAGDARALYENREVVGKFYERPFRSDEGGNSAATGKSDLEQMLKQVTVTRSKIQHPTTMENIPDELLINIFIRLLAKQLAQMRSVSKSWNALLSHPSFVKSHLQRSIRNNNNEQTLLVLHSYHKPFKQYLCKSPHIEPTNFIKHTPINPPKMVIGSVNGLIRLSEHSCSNIRIWNPSLSAVSAIPPPHSLTYISPLIHNLRFGFDPKTDDYKLVKISGVRGSESNVKEWLQVEVYSMRKGSWEFITQPFPSHIKIILSLDYLCVDGHDGHLHWQYTLGVWPTSTIVAFDLSSETFREMPLPHSILDSKHEWHELGVLGGKLCEMTWRRDDVFEVWVMEEYGVHESWAKRHVFSRFTRDWTLFYGFRSRIELLLKDRDNRLILYDPVANKTNLTLTENLVLKILEYVDSLVCI